jgi:hypothetical protein
VIAHDKDATKDFFERILVFVSKDENLTKAHVRWLEARFVELARRANRASVANGTDPIGGSLPEADAAEMQEFLDQALLLAATFGLSVFEATQVAETHASTTSEVSVPLRMKGDGYSAEARIVDGEFLVLKSSLARAHVVPSLNPSAKALRDELQAAKVLVPSSEGLRFTQDYAFGSPSGAAQVVLGASVNGWTAWKLDDGTPLDDYRDNLIELKAKQQPSTS